MSHPEQGYPPPATAYPPLGQSYPPPASTCLSAQSVPPPTGYPMREGTPYLQQVPVQTKSRGDGFWKGCAAALCCCCVLDACF